MVEAEDATHEPAVPQQVVERGEKHGSRGARRVEGRAGGHEHRSAVALDRQPLENACGNELVRGRLDLRCPCPTAQVPPVVRNAGIGQRASGENGTSDQLAQPCRFVGNRRVEHLAWEHALW